MRQLTSASPSGLATASALGSAPGSGLEETSTNKENTILKELTKVEMSVFFTTYSENMFDKSHFLSPDGQIQLMTKCIKQPAKLAVLQKKLVVKTF